MISPAQQQLDEALTNAGHDDTCPAFNGHRCPGYPACSGNPVAEDLYAAVGADRAAEQAKRPRVVSEVRPKTATDLDRSVIAFAERVAGEVVLTGAAALAFTRYQDAARDLRAATELYQGAQRKFQEAHQAFADAVAGV